MQKTNKPQGRKMLFILLAAIVLGGGLSAWAAQRQPAGPKNDHLRHLSGEKVAIEVGGRSFTVSLYENPTARDLLAQLPLTVKASDYAGYDEKLLRLTRSLSMEGAPPGDNPEIPEVGYYEPGRWIALYYGPIGYWAGKVPLGKIDATTAELKSIRNDAPVTIKRLPR